MEKLTNERFQKKFKSNFDLVNYSIKIADLHIKEHELESLSQILKELEDLPDLEEK
jgi:hypothetical protein